MNFQGTSGWALTVNAMFYNSAKVVEMTAQKELAIKFSDLNLVYGIRGKESEPSSVKGNMSD